MKEKDYLSLLHQYWGFDNFRGIQRQVIESIGAGHDTLCLMPTGGGKSITFQIPALAMRGICIVFTPLIALMKDQVEALRHRGIKAAYINSHMSYDEVLTILDNGVFGGYKFLYISPERLSSEIFINKLRRMEVCFITVDEAHCICQWGYDFRPSFLHIADIRDIFPQSPILALTATATPEVVRDIQQKLRFREDNVLQMSFMRRNLAYIVRREDSIFAGVLHALETIPGSCIIYTRSRQKCYELWELLNEFGETVTYYHAGLESHQKNERQERWLRGEVRVMVATNAFGMGIDKPDVRLVLHTDIPDSIEEYFQEAGRAGRDGEKSYAILLTDGNERRRISYRLAQTFPKLDYVRDVYELLCCFLNIAIGDGMLVTREFNINDFCRIYGYHSATLVSALDLLDKAGYIEYHDEEDASSRMHINVSRFELFRVLDSSEKQLILSVLRHYGGIFIDYVFINEDFLSQDTGLPADEIYQILLRLSQRHLLSYIPRKHMPHITFRCRRVDKEKVCLPSLVYQDRRTHYEQRVRAMLQYAQEDVNYCRSRMLLHYFGEKTDQNCGICDVCTRQKEQMLSADEYVALRSHILSQLQQGPLNSYDLDIVGFNSGIVEYVIDRMRASGEISLDGPLLKLVS